MFLDGLLKRSQRVLYENLTEFFLVMCAIIVAVFLARNPSLPCLIHSFILPLVCIEFKTKNRAAAKENDKRLPRSFKRKLITLD